MASHLLSAQGHLSLIPFQEVKGAVREVECFGHSRIIEDSTLPTSLALTLPEACLPGLSITGGERPSRYVVLASDLHEDEVLFQLDCA